MSMTSQHSEGAAPVGKRSPGLRARIEDALLDRERERIAGLADALAEVVTDQTANWREGLGKTLAKRIREIDSALSAQLAEIMHHPAFQRLEGTWRGLNHLVTNTATSEEIKLRVLNVSKRDLFKDVDRAVEFDESQIFKKVYENEFGMPGGEPFGALIGDFEFTNHPEDLDLLSKMSDVAAAAFCPFLTAASAELFGFNSFTELSMPRDMSKIFNTIEYAKWNSIRESDESRFVVLTMPRVLARLPYGSQTNPVQDFNFEEVDLDRQGRARQVAHDNYVWMNAAFSLGARLTNAFARDGWCTSIQGVESGGLVDGLPLHAFTSNEGDTVPKCPTECSINDRREAELSRLGFLPICHTKNTANAVFYSAQSVLKPKLHELPDDTADAAIAARLPHVLAVGRIVHYLKAITRDKIGSLTNAAICESWLNRWIARYVRPRDRPISEQEDNYPLLAAEIKIRETVGSPGSYHAVASLRPKLLFDVQKSSQPIHVKIPMLSV